MATDSDEVKNRDKEASQKAEKRKLKKDISSAKEKGPDAIREVIGRITQSHLPTAIQLELMLIASKALVDAEAARIPKGSTSPELQTAKQSLETAKLKWDEHVKTTYSEFNQIHEEYLTEQKQQKNSLKAILEAHDAGKDPSELIKNVAFKYTIAEEQEISAKIAEAQRVATINLDVKTQRKNEIRIETKNIGIDLDNPKQQLPEHLATQKVQYQNEWDDCTKDIKEAKIILKKTAEHYKEKDEIAALVEERLKRPNNPEALTQFLQELKSRKEPINPNSKVNLLEATLTVGAPNAKAFTKLEPQTNDRVIDSNKKDSKNLTQVKGTLKPEKKAVVFRDKNNEEVKLNQQAGIKLEAIKANLHKNPNILNAKVPITPVNVVAKNTGKGRC